MKYQSYDNTKHYKWNGSTWTSVSTLPYQFADGSAVVYNNEIYILGSNNTNNTANRTNHYRWNGTTWTSVSTLPYSFYAGSAVVYNNEIHIMGGNSSNSNQTKHYKWNSTSWVRIVQNKLYSPSTNRLTIPMPYSFYRGSAVIYNNEIHILGTDYYVFSANHYKYDGAWTEVSTLPFFLTKIANICCFCYFLHFIYPLFQIHLYTSSYFFSFQLYYP